jgi:hypothetical protein
MSTGLNEAEKLYTKYYIIIRVKIVTFLVQTLNVFSWRCDGAECAIVVS